MKERGYEPVSCLQSTWEYQIRPRKFLNLPVCRCRWGWEAVVYSRLGAAVYGPSWSAWGPNTEKRCKAFVSGGVMCPGVLQLVMDLCAFEEKKAISYHHQSVAFETRLLSLVYSQIVYGAG